MNSSTHTRSLVLLNVDICQGTHIREERKYLNDALKLMMIIMFVFSRKITKKSFFIILIIIGRQGDWRGSSCRSLGVASLATECRRFGNLFVPGRQPLRIDQRFFRRSSSRYYIYRRTQSFPRWMKTTFFFFFFLFSPDDDDIFQFNYNASFPLSSSLSVAWPVYSI